MSTPALSVVVPVFNEQDNVAPLVGEIVGFESVGDGVGITPASSLTTFEQISTVGVAMSMLSAPSAVSGAPNTRPRKYRAEPSGKVTRKE